MSSGIEIFKFTNGMSLVCRQSSSDVDYCGVVVNAGSRDESAETYGLAHFVEHTIFKGTRRRRSSHIINRMEAIGGELNAYTTKEETVIYSIFPHGHLLRATDLIADLVINSQFPQAEIDLEREVVASEIDSYLDAPADAVYDDFEDLLFADTPLGHNILGTINNINSFSPTDCRNYIKNFYTPHRIVFFYYGSDKPAHVANLVEKYFSALKSDSEVQRTVSFNGYVPPVFNTCKTIDSHQSHTIVGTTVNSMHHTDRHAIALLINILGGPCMNSRLNMELREHRGLVYTVEASAALLSDIGVATIYFGCDHKDISRCRRIINNQIQRLIDTPLTQRQLDNARRQYLGQLTLASDNATELAISTGRALLHYGKVATSDEIVEAFSRLTPADIQRAAALLAPERLSTLSLI
ncbi:MAG: insulinase family protein [Muribaculaceae bacterium]|nr:insulinase family protein [Muribaculaceae bacterium]MBR5437177.1 insulinase family protein [Muribaculaceae bacterium]